MSITRRRFLRSSLHLAGSGAIASMTPGYLLAGAGTGRAYLERSVVAMGTTVSIAAYGDHRDHLIHATSRAFQELYRMDALLSVFRTESDISRLNASSGKRMVAVRRETLEVLAEGKRYHAVTNGAFDMTVEPLMRALGFREHSGEGHALSTEEFLRCRESIGMENVQIEGGTVWIENERTQIDTGGIAVGYTIDRMAAILREEGIESALIDHGGDLYALGAPPDESGWCVSIEDPRADGEVMLTMPVTNASIATSSNQRTYRTIDTERVGHILDPRTGSNADSFDQVTVIAPTALAADALSTGLFNCRNESEIRSLAPGPLCDASWGFRCYVVRRGDLGGTWVV